jgi:hypothetical protein
VWQRGGKRVAKGWQFVDSIKIQVVEEKKGSFKQCPKMPMAFEQPFFIV